MGAAVALGLLARGVGKVYADANLDSSGISLSGAVPLFVAIGRQARAATLARDLTDVNLLVNCLVARHDSASSRVGTHPKTRDPYTPSVGHILNLIDAFAPVLSNNGGGAVVNVLCMLHADHLSDFAPATPSRHLAAWVMDWLHSRHN